MSGNETLSDNNNRDFFLDWVPMRVTYTAPDLQVTPLILGFSTPQGTNPATQTLTIDNIGTGTMNWTASESISWLSLSQTNGTLAAGASTPVDVSVDVTGLSVGTYSGQITVQAGTESVNVLVSLNVASGPPNLQVSPLSLTFPTATEGGSNPPNQAFNITNAGGGTLSWTISDNATWLSVDNPSGSGPATINALADISGLTAATYNGVITVTGGAGTSNSPRIINVTLPVAAASSSGWSSQPFGNADMQASLTISGGRLILNSDGSNNRLGSDSSLFFHRTAAITAGALDVRVQLFDAPDNAVGAGAGLELRNDPFNVDGVKIDFGLVWDGYQYLIQAFYRDNTGNNVTALGSATVNLSTPVWLRVEREAGTDTFNFYYLVQASAPTAAEWTAAGIYATATVSMNDQVYVGMYNTTGADGTYQTSEFDNFSVLAANCTAAAVTSPPSPPGLTICSNP